MPSALEEVTSIFSREGDHKAQLESLLVLLDRVFPTANQVNADELVNLVESVVGLESGSMVVSRQFVSTVVSRLDASALTTELTHSVAQRILDILSSRAISYEEQTSSLRVKLADLLEAGGKGLEAAHMLMGIPAETGQRPLAVDHRMELYLRIARLLLEAEQINESEQYVNRISMLQTSDEMLNVKYKVIYARVLDAKRKFIDASQRYYELSQNISLTRQEKEDALGKAITCIILASPGTPRTRILSTLYKDERSASLPLYGLLQKLFLDRLIKTTELAEFENGLAAHQSADERGDSIVRGVILEHNMTAASRLYTNVSIETLAALLGVDIDKAETVAVQMISTGRLTGTIDQIEGFVHFQKADPLRQWDEQILALCQQVNRVTEMIVAAHPELAIK